jgi:hypothetical protein
MLIAYRQTLINGKTLRQRGKLECRKIEDEFSFAV